MRKKIIDQEKKKVTNTDGEWLDLEQLAQIEISSEDSAYPIENVLSPGASSEWRASEPGKQTIRIIFDEPQRINNIHLLFEEKEQARTQEFVLRWSSGDDQPYKEIVRQQFNFSPDAATEEKENYAVNLENVRTVELIITPDIEVKSIRASLSSLLFV